MSVDTPGDLHLLNAMLTGVEVQCQEWDRVEKAQVEYRGRTYLKILCPAGCVKSTEDVERKCGVRYCRTPTGP